MAATSRIHLARKYRPMNFVEIVGQEIVVKNLKEALKQDRIGPAYLFYGPRGTGKTTCARIFARAVSCLSNDSGARPCDHCASCTAQLAGRSMDLIEMDGASHTGVDDARSIIETVAFRPSVGRKLVIIIDEVHMLSTAAFNALLKTLEEPPKHALFLFATTEPERIPDTILSRVQKLPLARLSDKVIVERLQDVLAQEKIEVPTPLIKQIAGSSDGALRDALTLLEQALLLSGGSTVKPELVSQFLGAIGTDQELVLLRHLAACKSDAMAVEPLLQAASLLSSQGKNLSLLVERFILWVRACLVAKATNSVTLASQDLVEGDVKEAMKAFQSWSFDELDFLFEILWQGMERLKKSPLPRVSLEMIFLRASRISQRVEAPSVDLVSHAAPSVVRAPAYEMSRSTSAEVLSLTSAEAPRSVAEASRPPDEAPRASQEDWLVQVKKKRPTLHALISSASRREIDTKSLRLFFTPGHFAFRQLTMPANRADLEAVLRSISGVADYAVIVQEVAAGKAAASDSKANDISSNAPRHFMKSAQKFALEDSAVKRAQEVLKGKVESVVISGIRNDLSS